MRIFWILGSLIFFLQVKAQAKDPLFFKQWYLNNTGQEFREDITDIKSELRYGKVGADIGWVKAQKILANKKLEDVVVAVLDMGVDYEHEDLKDNLFWNLKECPNKVLPLGVPTEDKDQNGYPGDCIGWDFTALKKSEPKHRPLDQVGHGTHVAGIIAALGNNGVGMEGVSNHLKILPIKITGPDEERMRLVSPTTERVASAIEYAVLRGAKVINLSIGWPRSFTSDRVVKALALAKERGVYVVAASGNNGHDIPVYPCALKNVICVGSLSYTGKVSAFSNYGGHVDILAPGEQILSTYPMLELPLQFPVRGYEIKSGTSQAAPIVSAALGVLISAFPNESYDEILGRLLQSTEPVESEKNFLSGALRLDRALEFRGDLDLRVSFKELSTLEVDESKKSRFLIDIYNPIPKSEVTDILLEVSVAGLALLKEKRRVSMSKSESLKIPIEIKVPNLDVQNKMRIKVHLNRKTYQHDVLLARAINKEFGWKAKPVLDLKDSERLESVLCLPEFEGRFSASYFNLSRGQNGKGIKLRLWRDQGVAISLSGEREFESAKIFLGLFALDANHDGQEDLLALTLNEVGDHFQLVLHYLKPEGLQALGVGLDSLPLTDFGDELFNLADLKDPKALILRETVIAGQKILTPGVMSQGLRPVPDRSRRELRGIGLKKSRHFYYLEPVTGGLLYRSVGGYKLESEIRDKLDLRFYDQFEPVVALGADRYLFRVGQLDQVQHILYDQKLNSWTLVDLGKSFIGAQISRLGFSKDADFGVFAQITNKRALFNVLTSDLRTSDSMILDVPDPTEFILKPLLMGRFQGRSGVVLEAGQELYGYLSLNGKTPQVFRAPLARSVFFGRTRSQITTPIELPSGEPALYVDNTIVNAPNIFIWELTESGFQTRLKNSHFIRSECNAMNPTRDSLTLAHKLAVFCRTTTGSEILMNTSW